MVQKEAVLAPSDKAPAPLPFFSQAIKSQGLVYCSGQVATDPKTGKLVEGSIADRAVCDSHRLLSASDSTFNINSTTLAEEPFLHHNICHVLY